MTENKPKMRLEVEKQQKQQKTQARRSPGMIEKISRFEDQDQKTNHIARKKPFLNLEVEKKKQQAARARHAKAAARTEEKCGDKQEDEEERKATRKNKHSTPPEAVKKKKPDVPLQAMNVKMTSPPN